MKFENIKVGDRIVYNTGGWYSERVVSKVVRVTPKQFVDDRDCRFDKINGCIIGDRWRRCELATEEDVKKFEEDKRRKFLAYSISNFARNCSNLYSLTTEELETVYAITKKYSPL